MKQQQIKQIEELLGAKYIGIPNCFYWNRFIRDTYYFDISLDGDIKTNRLLTKEQLIEIPKIMGWV